MAHDVCTECEGSGELYDDGEMDHPGTSAYAMARRDARWRFRRCPYCDVCRDCGERRVNGDMRRDPFDGDVVCCECMEERNDFRAEKGDRATGAVGGVGASPG